MDTYNLTKSEIEIIMALRDPAKREKLLRIKEQEDAEKKL